jgi:AraC family transcriptional regulator of adaptative response/methylated-DNA-[protein]-cysteine methyltransferase
MNADEPVPGPGSELPEGFHEVFARAFGDAGAQNPSTASVVLSWIESPIGLLVTGATDDGVCLLEFTEQKRLAQQLTMMRKLFGAAIAPGEHPLLAQLRAELDAYFAGVLTRFTVPLVYPGTPFERQVWEQLLEIPYGETRSYEQVAITIGSPAACRAVGRANGLNRIAIVIPCHRVLNKDGKLGGYGGGLWRKQRLLELERGVGLLPLDGARAAVPATARG